MNNTMPSMAQIAKLIAGNICLQDHVRARVQAINAFLNKGLS
jgi:hypothetical protein